MAKSSVHLIGNAHLDPVWLWPAAEGFAESRATFSSALERMEETPGFLFTASAAVLYQWIASTDPGLLERIRAAVKAGRWHIPGGWHTQSDCNLPAGESFARNALYSQRYFRETFGITSKTGYCVDSFGHAGSLPQLLALSGMNAYVFMRPMAHETQHVPTGPFVWEGTDGTQVLCFHLLDGYNTYTVDSIKAQAERIRAGDVPLGMVFYGVGDHGGGPTKALLAEIEKLRVAEPDVQYSHPDRFFEAIAEHRDRLPVFKGELQHHAIGCYSTLSALKKGNRQAVWQLLAAERLATLAHLYTQSPRVNARLKAAWLDVLFCDFHDIAGGSCERGASDANLQQISRAQFSAAEIVAEAVQQIASGIDTRGPGRALVVFNPHPFPISRVVDFGDAFYHPAFDDPERFRLTDAAGKPVPYQHVATSGRCHTLRFILSVSLPPLSWKLFHVEIPEKDPTTSLLWHPKYPTTDVPLSGFLTASKDALENEHVRLRVDAAGLIQLHDKVRNWDVFRTPGGVPLVLEDPSDTWSHDVFSYEGKSDTFKYVSREVMETGPLRAVLRVRFALNRSTLRVDYILERDAHRVRMQVALDWRECQRLLKFAFPVNVENGVWTSEIPYGRTQRLLNGKEYPMQTWTDLSSQALGLSIANDCKYSIDARDNTLRITTTRSPYFAHNPPVMSQPDDVPQDQGMHEFAFVLIPHGPDAWKQIHQEAALLNLPPIATWEGTHAGSRATESGPHLLVSNDAVMVSVLKLAEEGNGLIVRAMEIADRGSEVRFELPMLGCSWKAKFRAGEIKSFHIASAKPHVVREVNFLEE